MEEDVAGLGAPDPGRTPRARASPRVSTPEQASAAEDAASSRRECARWELAEAPCPPDERAARPRRASANQHAMTQLRRGREPYCLPALLDVVVSILITQREVSARVSAIVDAQCLDAMSETDVMYDINSSAAAGRLVGSDKGTTEKALAVLDTLLRTEDGRSAARAHALSDMATEFAMCKDTSSGSGGCNSNKADEEALQAGAFQLLLQVDCVGVTTERASELLRLAPSLRKHKAGGAHSTTYTS